MPKFARSRVATKPDEAHDHSTIEKGGRSGRGHIGLIVLSSVAAGLVLGLVLDVPVLGGSRETVITGLALLSLAVGCAMLAELSARRTDQPQHWARISALCFGITGAAILILRPSGHSLGLLGWVWPVLLVVLVVWMFRESRRSLHSWSRPAVLYPAFVVLTLVALGGAIETAVEATTSNQPPPGGRTYLVAGHSLYLRCAGAGSPVVILFNGLGERTPSWAWVQAGIARQTRVCVFDRAGEGWSGSGVGGQDAHQLSADVRGLLASANVPGPYVVAGHSVGGVYALAYAMDYPGDVAGVALLDSATPYQFDLPSYSTFYSVAHRVSGLLPPLARAGIVRVYIGLTSSGALPTDARSRAQTFASSPRELNADRVEFAELPTVLRQTKALTSLDGKPLFVLTADVGEQSGWAAAQNRLAALSTNGVHQTTHGATHQALLEDRHYAALSARAIDAVVRSVRTGASLSP
jgi:pimeloyl-ACP methyl ester carboxylesterase